MKFVDLPEPVQRLLHTEYEMQMRANFLEVEREVLDQFLQEEDIAVKWAAYRENVFQTEMAEAERQGAWDEFLADKGIEG